MPFLSNGETQVSGDYTTFCLSFTLFFNPLIIQNTFCSYKILPWDCLQWLASD